MDKSYFNVAQNVISMWGKMLFQSAAVISKWGITVIHFEKNRYKTGESNYGHGWYKNSPGLLLPPE